MRFWFAILALLLCMPVLAHAGGSGEIKLTRPVTRVTIDKNPITFQLLQHGVTPRADAKVQISATSPRGTHHYTTAQVDPASGDEYHWKGNFVPDQPGIWTVRIATTESVIFFPPLEFQVEVVPREAAQPAPGAGYTLPLTGAVGVALIAGLLLYRRPGA